MKRRHRKCNFESVLTQKNC